MVKHAHASSAEVRVTVNDDGTVLTVDDDGIGFEPSAVPGGHLGVAGMRARAGLIGGRFDIGRRAGGGTRMQVRVPRSEGASAEPSVVESEAAASPLS